MVIIIKFECSPKKIKSDSFCDKIKNLNDNYKYRKHSFNDFTVKLVISKIKLLTIQSTTDQKVP